jgi:hypothetical protein
MVDPERVIRMRLEDMFCKIQDAGENVSLRASDLAAALRWREFLARMPRASSGESRARAVEGVLRDRKVPLEEMGDEQMVNTHAPEVYAMYQKAVSEGDCSAMGVAEFEGVETAARAMAFKRPSFVGKCVEAVLLGKEEVADQRRIFRFAVEQEDERSQTEAFRSDMRDVERKHKKARLEEESTKMTEMLKLEAKYEKNKHEYARRLMSLEILKLD